MTRTRVTLTTAALVSSVVLMESVILTLYGYGFNVASSAAFDSTQGGLQNSQSVLPYLPGILVSDVIIAAAFGVGVFVALRLLRPISFELSWRRVALRGIVAAAIGAVAILAARLLETLLTAVRIGPYPLGYSFTPSFDPGNAQVGVLNAFGQLLNPFVIYVPIVVLACVFLKLWRANVPPVHR